MKTALIFFRPTQNSFDGEYYKNVVGTFNDGGFTVSTVQILSNTDDIAFKRVFEDLSDVVDNLVVIGGDKAVFDFKSIIAKCLDTVFVENENAKTFLDAVSKADGVNYPESYAHLPLEGTVIPNINGGFQGFILDCNELTLSVLPDSYREIKLMCDKYVLPYLENKLGVQRKRLVLKCFGNKEAVEKTLAEAENIGVDGFSYSVTEKFGDLTINILFNEKMGDDVRSEIIRYVVSNHKDEIYAEFETTLGERLFDVLKLKKLRLAVAESFTGGKVVSQVIKNSGASEFVHEGIVSYSNESKIKRLGVVQEDLNKHGAVSSVVAYQMAAGLLKNANVDVAIATTGIAGPKSDNTQKPVGLCYFAVGTRDGVHTYRYNLNGSRENITETAVNTALFLAIKKLKNM